MVEIAIGKIEMVCVDDLKVKEIKNYLEFYEKKILQMILILFKFFEKWNKPILDF